LLAISDLQIESPVSNNLLSQSVKNHTNHIYHKLQKQKPKFDLKISGGRHCRIYLYIQTGYYKKYPAILGLRNPIHIVNVKIRTFVPGYSVHIGQGIALIRTDILARNIQSYGSCLLNPIKVSPIESIVVDVSCHIIPPVLMIVLTLMVILYDIISYL